MADPDAGVEPATTTATSPTTTKSFTPFPRLPGELRIKIWKYALADVGPRYIVIRSQNPVYLNNPMFNPFRSYPNFPYNLLLTRLWHPAHDEKAPVLFFVCQESRTEVLKVYKPLRGNEVGKPAVFCNLNTDYICLIRRWASQMTIEDFSDDVLEGLTHLAFDCVDAYFSLTPGKERIQKVYQSNLKVLAVTTRYQGPISASFQFRPSGVKADGEMGLHWLTQRHRSVVRRHSAETFKAIETKHSKWVPPTLVFGNFIQ